MYFRRIDDFTNYLVKTSIAYRIGSIEILLNHEKKWKIKMLIHSRGHVKQWAPTTINAVTSLPYKVM